MTRRDSLRLPLCRVSILSLGLLLFPWLCLAQSGVNLSWNDCGQSGTAHQQFACNTNSGSAELVVSAVSGVAIPQLRATEVVVDMATREPALSPWWNLQTGGCRAGALAWSADFTTSSGACVDVWQGAAITAGVFQTVAGQPNRGRLRGVAAIAASTSTGGEDELYVFKFVISYAKTVGDGSCAGCTSPACFVVTSVKLAQPAPLEEYTISGPIERDSAVWGCLNAAPFTLSTVDPCPYPSCATPAREGSWGAIKSLYR